MFSIASAFDSPKVSDWFQVHAPDQRLPGTRIRLPAPAARMAAIAALAAPTH